VEVQLRQILQDRAILQAKGLAVVWVQTANTIKQLLAVAVAQEAKVAIRQMIMPVQVE
jgi:hypothetical protein